MTNLDKIRIDIHSSGLEGFGDVTPADIVLTQLTGGLTNILYKATLPESYPHKPLLVRIFGVSDGLLDRTVENKLFAVLSADRVCPKLYGIYSWGRLEEYISDHYPLKSGGDMIREDMVGLVGRALRRVHAIQLPRDLCRIATADIFDLHNKWLNLVNKYKDKIHSLPSSMNPHHPISISSLSAAVAYTHSTFETSIRGIPTHTGSTVCKNLLSTVLCHNDLLAGNLMFNPDSKSLRMIDFEYAGMNYEAADIANVLAAVSESIMLSGEPQDVRRNYPSGSIQLELVEACTGMAVPEPERSSVLLILLFFAMADELRWTLWGVIQSVQSTIGDFDYMFYYNSRYNSFLDYRDMFERGLRDLATAPNGYHNVVHS